MNVESRITSLKTRHAALDRQLETENARPLPDEDMIRTLKHEKLSLKDEISRMQPA